MEIMNKDALEGKIEESGIEDYSMKKYK